MTRPCGCNEAGEGELRGAVSDVVRPPLVHTTGDLTLARLKITRVAAPDRYRLRCEREENVMDEEQLVVEEVDREAADAGAELGQVGLETATRLQHSAGVPAPDVTATAAVLS